MESLGIYIVFGLWGLLMLIALANRIRVSILKEMNRRWFESSMTIDKIREQLDRGYRQYNVIYLRGIDSRIAEFATGDQVRQLAQDPKITLHTVRGVG